MVHTERHYSSIRSLCGSMLTLSVAGISCGVSRITRNLSCTTVLKQNTCTVGLQPIDFLLKHENQINKLIFFSLSVPPPPQLSPLLSPRQWRPPRRDASLLRGFLCSLVSQVNTCMGQRREGGRQPHHFLLVISIIFRALIQQVQTRKGYRLLQEIQAILHSTWKFFRNHFKAG